jgi:Xaa-Pro aminopeptidase
MPWKPPERAGATVVIWAGYSLAERERRWRAVREKAGRAGFDCIFVPLGDGIDGRYLTQLRCSSMVLPCDGRAPVVIADRSSRNDWVPEPWQTGREWAEPMAEALLEAGMERGRIGVAGLKGGKYTHVRSPAGVVNHTAFAGVMRRLPHASFEDATDVVGAVRYVKSDEEISCLRRAAQIAEAGIDEIVKQARPQVDAAVLYAAAMERMLELRSEYTPLALSIDPVGTAGPRRYTNPPIGRRLEKGALLTNEVHAVWGAQIAQESQPILLGSIPDAWKPVIEVQRELFEAGLELMKPGVSFGALMDLAGGFGKTRGMEGSTLLHGCGYGDDGPLLTPHSEGQRLRDLCLEKDNAFVWKPVAASADGRISFSWGASVVVTERGGERLSRRPHGMISV